MTIDPKSTPTSKLHSFLLGSIGPRPIALASTVDSSGVPNLSPFSFFNVFSANPPIVIFSPARRGRDNTTKHTYHNAKDTREVVINAVNFDIVQQTSLSSTEYPAGVDEFKKSGLTPIASHLIKPFRVAESPVQMECVVRDVVELGTDAGAGNLIICEVVLLHISEQYLDVEGKIDQHKIDLVGRMGGDFYCRAHGTALFEVPKPIATLGIGVDQIPFAIRNSKILSGNDLGMLGNVESLPDETSVNEFKLMELSELFIEFSNDARQLEEKLHYKAKSYLSKNEVELAWKTLLAFNN